jgi:hypothetical protein
MVISFAAIFDRIPVTSTFCAYRLLLLLKEANKTNTAKYFLVFISRFYFKKNAHNSTKARF